LVFSWLWRNANVGLVGNNVLDTYGEEVSNGGIMITGRRPFCMMYLGMCILILYSYIYGFLWVWQ
jgi:hypothetical protein